MFVADCKLASSEGYNCIQTITPQYKLPSFNLFFSSMNAGVTRKGHQTRGARKDRQVSLELQEPSKPPESLLCCV